MSTVHLRYGPSIEYDLSWHEGSSCNTATSLRRRLDDLLRGKGYHREKAWWALQHFQSLVLELANADYKTAEPLPSAAFHPLELLLRPLYALDADLYEATVKALTPEHRRRLMDAVNQLVRLSQRQRIAAEVVARRPSLKAAKEIVSFALRDHPEDFLDHLCRWADAGARFVQVALTTPFAAPAAEPSEWLPPLLEVDALPELIVAYPTCPFNVYLARKSSAYRGQVAAGLTHQQQQLVKITTKLTRRLA